LADGDAGILPGTTLGLRKDLFSAVSLRAATFLWRAGVGR
jgi:hypothetical protein